LGQPFEIDHDFHFQIFLPSQTLTFYLYHSTLCNSSTWNTSF